MYENVEKFSSGGFNSKFLDYFIDIPISNWQGLIVYSAALQYQQFNGMNFWLFDMFQVKSEMLNNRTKETLGNAVLV